MRIVLSEHVDPETGEKWELAKFDPAPTYLYWIDFYRDKDSAYPLHHIPFTSGAEAWRAEIMNEKEIRK